MTTAAFWGVSRHLLQEEIQSFPTVPQSMAKANRNTVIGTHVFGKPLSLFGKRMVRTVHVSPHLPRSLEVADPAILGTVQPRNADEWPE